MKQIIFLLAMALGVTALSFWSHRPRPLADDFNHQPVILPERGAGLLVLGRRIPINHAGYEDLMSLQGIGPNRAASILRFREEHGPFTKLDSLLEVPGIGPKIFRELTPQVTISETLPSVQK